MRTLPDAADLLSIAEKTLRDQVTAGVSAGQRYNVAMVAAAMRLARCEIKGGPSAWSGELSSLRSLYGERNGDDTEALLRLNRRFAQDLRSGAFEIDGGLPEPVINLLVEEVMARLQEDNPGYVR